MPQGPRARRIRVCLLSAHPLALAEFAHLLSIPSFQVLSRPLEPTWRLDLSRLALPTAQLYIVDCHAPRPVTEALLARISHRRPTAKVLVLSDKFSQANAFPLLRLRAKGLVSYGEVRQHLARAAQEVAAGGFWVPRALLSRFVDSVLSMVSSRHVVKSPEELTQRQQEVLDCLLHNLSNKEISTKLHMSESTVKFHVSNLLAKFGLRRRADLILLCYQSRPMAS